MGARSTLALVAGIPPLRATRLQRRCWLHPPPQQQPARLLAIFASPPSSCQCWTTTTTSTTTTKTETIKGRRRGTPNLRGGIVAGSKDVVAFSFFQCLSSSSSSFFSSSSSFPEKGFEILIDPRQGGGGGTGRHRGRRGEGGPSTSSTIKFVDKMRMVAKGGQGGKGSLSLESIARKHRLRPDGGHGGNGGSVVLVATPNMTSLNGLRHHVAAVKGGNGTSQNRNGKAGTNAVVQVPCGVLVKAARVTAQQPHGVGIIDDNNNSLDDVDDQRSVTSSPESSGVEFILFDTEDDLVAFEQSVGSESTSRHNDDSATTVLADLDAPGSYCVVAKGGTGGRGTARYSGYHGPLPDARVLIQDAQGGDGQVVHLELVLKLIGDVGLVGFPNAGKSSTLAALSRASPKVAPYPFTTLHPIVGVVEYHDGYRIRMADIPGLVDGASDGKGQGLDFLRHVERTKALLYVLDAADEPLERLRVLVKEVTSYDATLLSRPAVVAANKVDLLAAGGEATEMEQNVQLSELLRQLQCAAHDFGIQCEDRVVAMSAGETGQGLRELSAMLRSVVEASEQCQDESGPSELLGD